MYIYWNIILHFTKYEHEVFVYFIFVLKIHQTGQIEHPSGPILACDRMFDTP